MNDADDVVEVRLGLGKELILEVGGLLELGGDRVGCVA